MAKVMVKCKYCGERFDRNSEPCEKVDTRRYAHKKCIESVVKEVSKEENDFTSLENYIKKLFKIDNIPIKIRKQIREYREDYDYSYSGMQKTLYWWFELADHSIEDALGGIGIIPYVYEDALTFYRKVHNAQIEMMNIDTLVLPPKTVVIKRPVSVRQVKLFNIEGGGANEI